MPHTQDIVQKLWNLCNILKDDGVTYQDYVTELTFLLFLKMAHETNREGEIPEGYRWTDLETKNEAEMLTFYRKLLLHLGTEAKNPRVLEIFANASISLRQPRHLTREEVLQYSPMLAGKLAAVAEKGVAAVAADIYGAVRPAGPPPASHASLPTSNQK